MSPAEKDDKQEFCIPLALLEKLINGESDPSKYTTEEKEQMRKNGVEILIDLNKLKADRDTKTKYLQLLSQIHRERSKNKG